MNMKISEMVFAAVITATVLSFIGALAYGCVAGPCVEGELQPGNSCINRKHRIVQVEGRTFCKCTP